MAKVGRPPKIKEVEMPDLVRKFADYIENTDIPILAEFAYKNDVTRPWLYDQPEFSTLLKKCTDKKESALEIGMLTGSLNATGSIFSLKQLGWRDKQDIEHSGAMTHEHKHDLKKLSTKELAQLESILSKSADSG